MHTTCSTTFRRMAWIGFISASFLPATQVGAQHTTRKSSDTRQNRDAKAGEDEFSFLRLVRNADQEPVALEVAIARYVPANGKPRGLTVDLISAIHVADGKYYADLNKRFRRYDAVLYELVAPEGTRVPKGGVQRDSFVSMLQGGMTGVLGLTFQLDEVDYTRRNLIHADMTPEEFSQSMKDRGESMLTIFFKLMAEGLSQQARDPTGTNELKLMAALFSANREHDLKVVMAEQFADMDAMMGVFGGKNGSTLVTERNKKALSVLKRQIAKGGRRLAIFYGAGHMLDLEARLEKDFGLRRESIDWISAWDLSQGPAARKAKKKSK